MVKLKPKRAVGTFGHAQDPRVRAAQLEQDRLQNVLVHLHVACEAVQLVSYLCAILRHQKIEGVSKQGPFTKAQ